MDKPIHIEIQQYTDTLCVTQRQMNLTTSLLQDIHTFHGQDTTKLEDQLSDIKTAVDILKENDAHLAKANSHKLTHTLICEALIAGKSWDDIRYVIHLKLCNTNIHTYTSHFMEIQQKGNWILAAYAHSFKMEAKRCDTVAICIFVKGLWDTCNITGKVYKKDLQTLSEVIKLVEKLNTAQQVTATLSPPTVNMISSDNRCFVCGRKGHIGHHCSDVQCYNCDDFGHFAQDCPEKISPSDNLITVIDITLPP